MRISDWSSDVCSSDLPQAAAALPEPSFDIIRIEPDGQSIIAGRAAPGSEWILLTNGSPLAALRADANGQWVVLPEDRKSVVLGKGVSVGVDRGGRRIIKNKITSSTHRTPSAS